MQIKTLLLYLSIITLCFFYVGTASANDLSTEQKRVLKDYIAKVGKKGSIPPEFIQARVPDLNIKEFGFVVLFTHEDPDGNGSIDYDQILTVFGTKETGYKVLDSKRVGGKIYRSISLVRIPNAQIEFKAMFYSEEDGACCPSIPGETAYYINKNGKLEEIGTRIFLGKINP